MAGSDAARLWDQARDYFSQLDQEEIYGWVAAGAGLVLVVVGLVLL